MNRHPLPRHVEPHLVQTEQPARGQADAKPDAFAIYFALGFECSESVSGAQPASLIGIRNFRDSVGTSHAKGKHSPKED